MKYYRLFIRPTSLQLSRWDADTIFGVLCWALLHREGEDALKQFLEPFREGEPSFLVSEGIPADYLPIPFSVRLINNSKIEDKESYQKHKILKKVRYLPESTFVKACRGEAVEVDEAAQNLIKEETQLHSSINRISGTTTKGEDEGTASLFQLHGWVPGSPNGQISIYLCDRTGQEIDRFMTLFRDVEKTGFGKKKSSGLGAFQIVGEVEEWNPPIPIEQANGFVSLSGFVPAQKDPITGFWQIRVKHGKLGEAYATGGNPFKMPWILLEAGSTFYTDSAPHEVYGRMLENISPHYEDVVQYGYAFPIPIIFPDQLIRKAQ